MATITKLAGLRHLRAEPNQYILHYRAGKLARQGAGIAYWFLPMSASIAQLPVEDAEATCILNERTIDMQAINVQAVIRYRIHDPERAARRVNFTISTATGTWTEQPLEKLTEFWHQRVQEPARKALSGMALTEAVRSGAEAVHNAIRAAFEHDPELADMGLAIVEVHVVRVSPSSEMEKALQTPARESMQQKADEAIFRRRADAVEKERAIKENELATQIELEKRNEMLIAQQGANKVREVTQDAEAEKLAALAGIERANLQATATAEHIRLRADADADAARALGQANADAEAARAAAWKDLPSKVLLGLAAIEFARKIEHIQHLNVSPNMLGDLLGEFLQGKVDA
ncbi:MAG: SPFH domain-containing protein [Planctomycetes bacterium]|nr:SPFH domain-containing protein [Planctomycetota bacterium]